MNSSTTDAKSEIPSDRERTVVTEISAIIEFAENRLDSIHTMVPTIDQAKIGFQSLEKLKCIVAELGTILDRGVNSLKDEEAKLLARLSEIKKAKSEIVPGCAKPDAPVNKPKSENVRPAVRRWGDESEDDVDTDDKPRPQVSSSKNDQVEAHDDDFRKQRGNRRGGRGRNSDNRKPIRNGGWDGLDSRGDSRGEVRRSNDQPKREYKMGDRIPKESPYPMMLERRATLDDIRGFRISISPDRDRSNYGQVISFIFGEHTVKIGGIIKVVPEKSGPRPYMCEPLLYNGKCQCAGRALPPHANHPVEVPIAGLVGIIHKFLINHNGNTFRPGEVSDIHIDAVLLRCVVHAIVQLLGVKSVSTPPDITLDSFSDVVDPKNLNAAMENYFRNRGDENPKAVARGLWIAVATHFVSS